MQIQKLTAEDTALLEQITAIEQQSFTDPWSLQNFVDAANNTCTTIWAAVENEQVQGYVVCFCAAGEAEISNIAAAPDCRRKGIGALLLQTALDAHPEADFYLEVRVRNFPARKLYEKFGFQDLGIRPDYYENPRENAVIMKRGAPAGSLGL
ncbi:MAG: ribosomal protein S18-alanine N-acetyltransferase [Oscillospiraceae bacterium]|nr:ribosomal protein S18-alanine N-acetyltransferase [Oscillospiraceae bacterium]